MAKRSILHIYDLTSAAIVAFLLSFAFTTPAFAYVDPSVMTYTIQAVAGAAVALSAVAGAAFRRGRKVLNKVLDIDEDAHKTIEPAIYRLDETGNPIFDGQPPCSGETQIGPDGDSQSGSPRRKRTPIFGGKPYKPGVKERLAYGAIIALFFTFTIYFAAPLEVVAGAAADLTYSLADVWWVLIPPGLGIVALITLVLSILRGRAFGVVLMLVFAVGLAAYLQALVLNIGLPAADGSTIVWGDYLAIAALSTSVWVILIAIAVIGALFYPKRSQGIAALIAVAAVIVQTVGLASLVISPVISDTVPKGKPIMTEDGLYTVNSDNNVIVFVLDTYDTGYLTQVLKTNPNLLDGLTGFTNYENATSAMIPTRFAIPFMLTGEMPNFDEPFSTYKQQRYARSTFLDSIYNANYSIGLYTDSMRISELSSDEQLGITSKTVNIHDLSNSIMNYGGTLYALYQMGQYRDAPWPFKWAFWYYTDSINQSMASADEATEPSETAYIMDDGRYYTRLKQIKLSIDDDGHDGAFRFIHLMGSHYPFSYDEYANYIGEDQSNVFRQSQGAIHIVTEYINQLKALGVYDNTTIIITADHGYWTITEDPIEETSTPIMFVKPAQSAQEDAQPIKTDEKPVSHLDLQATALDAMGLDWSTYADRGQWSGYSMFGSIDPDRQRYYLTTDSLPDLTETQFREYLISGNSLNWNNWTMTGRTIDAQR